MNRLRWPQEKGMTRVASRGNSSSAGVTRAVTIRQPEVTRLAAGEVRIEVKTWRTEYRGEILLVSALTPWIEPAGYAIAIGRLVDCRPMTRADELDAGKRRYANAQAWVFADVKPIRIFPVKIGRNVFDVLIPSCGIQRIAKVTLTPTMDWSRKRSDSFKHEPPTPGPGPGGKARSKRAIREVDQAGQPERLDVLIIDADQLLARGMQRSVLSEHRVRVAPTYSEALTAVKARVPDVVICDFQLAGESSAPLLRALAAKHPQVRRVLYSSSRRNIWTRAIAGELVHGAVTKPATRQQLLALISS
jgi:CheY-like chemotaxis protein